MTNPWTEIDLMLVSGWPSLTTWEMYGRRAGVSLEAVVMRRRAIIAALATAW